MKPKTLAVMKKVVFYFWDGIIGRDNEEIWYPWGAIKNTPSLSINIQLPDNNRDEWIQAINAMRAYNVLEYDIRIDGKFSPTAIKSIVDSIEDDNSSDESAGTVFEGKTDVTFVIHDFNSARFIDFCDIFNIHLYEEFLLHEAKLVIDGTTPIVIIDNKKYIFEDRKYSPTLRMVILALLRRKKMLKVKDLNALGADKRIVEEYLGKKPLKLTINAKIKREFFRRNHFPKILQDNFLIVRDGYIYGKDIVRIDDEIKAEIIKQSLN